MTTQHAGAEWIRSQLPYTNKDRKGKAKNANAIMSPLGVAVADLLGELFYGIYHLDPKALFRVDWTNERFIELTLGHKQLATADYDDLTRLVFLAHHLAIRVAIEASSHNYLHLIFHQRTRNGSGSYKHLTLDQAVEAFKAQMEDGGVVEYKDAEGDSNAES